MKGANGFPTAKNGAESDPAVRTARNRSLDRLVLLLFHCSSSAFVALLCVYGGGPSYRRFGVQLVVMAALVLATSLLLHLRTRRTQTYIMFYFRMTFLVILRLMTAEEGPLFGLLLLLPFVADGASCLGPRAGVFLSAAMTGCFIALDFLFLRGGSLVATASGAFLEAGLAAALVYYRRRVASDAETLEKAIRDRANLTQAIERLTSVNSGYRNFAENERNRITREIHDVVGYALINVKMLMNVGKVYLRKRSGDLLSIFDSASGQVDSALQETRQILYEQRAMNPGERGGLASINALAKTFREIADVEIEINYGNLPAAVDGRIERTIYRMVQEGLVNAYKHGNADRIWISLWRTADQLLVNVRDNGIGADQGGDGIGLKGIRERLSELGGSLEARRVADGYVLDARIPIAGMQEAEHGA